MTDQIDTSTAAVERYCHAAPFADNETGIPQMVALIRALAAERDRQYDQNCEQIIRIAQIEAERDALRKALTRAQWALQPFSDRVFNDNGDCTVGNTSFSAQRIKDAHFAYRAIRAVLDPRP